VSNAEVCVTARPLSPPLPLMTLATRRPPGRRRSEFPEFPPVPSCSWSPPAAAPVSEARRSRCSGGAITTRQAARRLAPVCSSQLPATLQRPGRRSTRCQDFPKNTRGNVDVVSETTVFVIFARAKFYTYSTYKTAEIFLPVILPLTSILHLPPPGSRTSPAEGNEPDH